MKRVILIGILALSVLRSNADEGMWLLPYIEKLNIATMQEMGCKLTAEQIYSVNNSSIKDAIAIFGGGCTSEMVSEKGLLFTNHHCGYDNIQNHSSLENDYLTDGFWAMSMEEELPNPDLTVKFLTRIEDVTERFDSALSDTLNLDARMKVIRELSNHLIDEAPEDSTYSVIVEPFFAGNQYLLIVYQVFSDVRLVGAPPSSIGKYGGDTDNWMWPRHTGDFAVFRVYAAPDGSPAEYSKDNVPLKPKHSLPVSIKGVKENDFAMILGFPGSTNRYITSFGLKHVTDIINANRRDIRGVRLEVLEKAMAESDEIRIKYASKQSRSSNYYKYSIGQNRGLHRLKVADKKLAIEKEFQAWANENDERKEIYGDVLSNLEEAYNNRAEYLYQLMYIYESFFYSVDIIDLAWDMVMLRIKYQADSTPTEEIQDEIESIRETSIQKFKEFDLETDKAVAIALLNNYYKNVDKAVQPEMIRKAGEKNGGDFTSFYEKIYSKTIFANQEKFNAFLDNPSYKALMKDPGYKFYMDIGKTLRKIDAAQQEPYNQIKDNNRLFVRGLMEMDKNNVQYPDANFTMRMTYGKVLSYKPFDAAYYDYHTTIDGIFEKEDSTSSEFTVPKKLKELYEARDFGPYGDDNLTICFITNNDITGGNSGSPVLNKDGHLIGLAFDGNWEAMSGDIAFEPEIQRTIAVDVRYVLFIIDKFAGASHLIEELDIR